MINKTAKIEYLFSIISRHLMYPNFTNKGSISISSTRSLLDVSGRHMRIETRMTLFLKAIILFMND